MRSRWGCGCTVRRRAGADTRQVFPPPNVELGNGADDARTLTELSPSRDASCGRLHGNPYVRSTVDRAACIGGFERNLVVPQRHNATV
jgi:hypothetical protein